MFICEIIPFCVTNINNECVLPTYFFFCSTSNKYHCVALGWRQWRLSLALELGLTIGTIWVRLTVHECSSYIIIL